MNKEEYETFYNALISAERAPLHDCDVSNPKVYEGCMPVEVMAQRGEGTLRFGPMKPVGLVNPKTGHRPWAVLQLRKENKAGNMYNLVGFQTNLKFPEQKECFRLFLHSIMRTLFVMVLCTEILFLIRREYLTAIFLLRTIIVFFCRSDYRR